MPLRSRLIGFLSANPGRRFCLRCNAQSLEVPMRDVRAVVKVALTSHLGIRVERGSCDGCRLVGAVVSLKS